MSETNFIHESEASYSSTAIKYGIIGALVTAAIGLVMYMTDMMDPANSTIGNVINLLVFLGAIIMAIKTHRDDDLNGFISFGRAFGVAFMATLVMSVIGAIWSYVFMGFIAPDMIDMIKEAQMQGMLEQGLDEDQIEQAMEMSASFMSPGMISIFALIGSLIMGAIVGLIVAAVMKKDHPATV